MQKKTYAFIALTIVLSACKASPETSGAPSQEPQQQDAAVESETVKNVAREVERSGADQMDESGRYTSYTDGVIGNGMQSVLFFYAPWCPKCAANDAYLTEWYPSEEFTRSVYKIDYDTATDLKKMYGITQQDTFVLIDGNGTEITRVVFPSKQALRDLLE